MEVSGNCPSCVQGASNLCQKRDLERRLPKACYLTQGQTGSAAQPSCDQSRPFDWI